MCAITIHVDFHFSRTTRLNIEVSLEKVKKNSGQIEDIKVIHNIDGRQVMQI